MASNRVKVPRASVAITILTDNDYVHLMSKGRAGRAACWTFVGLVCAAKDLRNGGVFTEPLSVVAGKLHIPRRDLMDDLGLIIRTCEEMKSAPWIMVQGEVITIRNYAKWHSWGGAREGPSSDQDGGQDAHQDGGQDASKIGHTAPAPARSAPLVGIKPDDPRGRAGERGRAGQAGAERAEPVGLEAATLALTDPVAALLACGVNRDEADSLAQCVKPERIGNAIAAMQSGQWPDNPTKAFRSMLLRKSNENELTKLGQGIAKIEKCRPRRGARTA